MIVREAKLLNGSKSQYSRLDDAIRTAQFIRNKAVRLWRDERDVDKSRISRLCKELAKEFPFANKLNSMARQASGERAWNSISSFYRRCPEGAKKKGYPQFKKHCRSVEYKTTGWKLSDDCKSMNFTDGFKAGEFSLFCNSDVRKDLFTLKINRVRVVRRADGYYAQFCFNANRSEPGNYTGKVVGLDLGLNYFYKDTNDNAAIYPKYLRSSEKRIKKLQRRLSRKFVKGKKPVRSPDCESGACGRVDSQPQSNNYHKARKRLGKAHLKVQRQRKDWAVKLARCVVASNDVVVYEDLKIQNMVKNHHLAKSISDAGWYQFTQWLDYFGKVWDKAVISVSPHFTSADCSNCGFRVKKSLSTRTHKCPKCQTEICRDTNAALNILKKGMSILGAEYNSTEGHSETASFEETLGETSTSVNEETSDLISGVDEPRISNS
jgi:putative transposase